MLDVDTFDGRAWVGIVPFVMRGVRPRWLPAVPGLSAFPELNVRTYVYERGRGSRAAGKPGVWFFSLDAGQPVAVRLARLAFRLPYFDARMTAATGADGAVRYVSHRTHSGAPEADFRARYRPIAPPSTEPDGLTQFLTERYFLYAARSGGGNATRAGARIYRGEIHHRPWPPAGRGAGRDEHALRGVAVRSAGLRAAPALFAPPRRARLDAQAGGGRVSRPPCRASPFARHSGELMGKKREASSRREALATRVHAPPQVRVAARAAPPGSAARPRGCSCPGRRCQPRPSRTENRSRPAE